MARGLNRAEPSVRLQRALEGLGELLREHKSDLQISERATTTCVFISRIRHDTQSCIPIAEYLLDAGIDVYFDQYDRTLEELVREGNADKVTKRIQEGIDQSSHMICVVSSATVNFYWVPFEVGYGYGKLPLGVLTLKGLRDEELPDYLRTTRIIRGTLSFNSFVAELLGDDRRSLEDRLIITKHTDRQHVLDDVLDWAK